MSRFGNSIPNVVPQPSVPARSLFSDALASAFGVASMTVQADRAQVRRDSENARLAQTMDLEQDEVERARIRLDTSTQRLESLQTQLDTDEQRELAKQLVDQEDLGLQAILAKMQPEEAAKYLADHPAVDPNNAERYARYLGDQLAASSLTNVQQSIVGAPDPGAVSIADLVDLEMRRTPIERMHPAAAVAFKGNLLGQAAQIQRGAIMRANGERQRQAADGAAASSMGIIMLGAADGMWGVEAIDALRSNAVLRGVADTDTAFAQQAFAPDVVRAWAETKQRMGDDPAALKRFSAWVEGTIGAAPTEHLQREMRDAVRATGILTDAAQSIRGVENAIRNQTTRAIQQQIDDKAAIGDIPGLETLREQAGQYGLEDHWKAKRLSADTSKADSLAILDFLVGDAESMPKGYTRESLEWAWSQASGAGLAPFILRTGDVPDSVVDTIKGSMASGQFGEAFATFREIDGIMPERARQIAGSVEGGDRLRIAANMLRGVDINQPGFQAIFNVFADPNAAKVFASADAKFDTSKDGAIQAADTVRATLGVQNVSATASQAFRDAYSFRYAQAAMGGEIDEDAVLQQAKSDIRRSHITVGGQAVPSDVFGVGNSVDADQRGLAAIESAITAFRAREEGRTSDRITLGTVLRPTFANVFFPKEPDEPGAGGKVLTERAISFNGKAYIPAAVDDPQAGVPVAKRFMEWDPLTREVRYLNADSPSTDDRDTIKALQGMFDGRISPMELSPVWAIRWRDEYGTRDLQKYDAATGGQFSRLVKATALQTFGKMYGPPPAQSELDSPIASIRTNAAKRADLLDKLATFLAERAGWEIQQGTSTDATPKPTPKPKAEASE